MASPDRSVPTTRTLLELYDDRKAQLGKTANHASDGTTRDEDVHYLEHHLRPDELIGPVGNAIFWSTALGMVHFTLDVLVYNQYQQQIEWQAILTRTGVVLPVMFLIVYMMSSKTARKTGPLRTLLIFAIGVVAGCYTIHITNRYDYFAVMKQAPPVGTLWIWSVAEMKLEFAAASVLIDLGFLWWKGYSAY